MALNDPAGLAQRIPELEALAGDPGIRRAIGTGDSFKVYRALVWAKWRKRLPDHQATLAALVQNRRLFAKPLNGTPALATFNTVGFSFVGRSEADDDGTYIALHAFVVLYLIPIIPLRSYLVKKVDSSLFSSKWSIFARVPSSLFGWLYSRGLALGLVALVGWGAVDNVIKSRTQDIVVVNGFDVPLNVELDGVRTTVAPMGHETINVKVGAVQGSASAKGVVVDTLRQQVASSSGHTIWNIAGAAPVFQERVAYTRSKTAAAADNGEPTVYCGQQFIDVPHVEDAFSAPPQSVNMNRHTDHVYRTHLDLVPVDQHPGYVACLYYLSGRDQQKKAVRFLEAEAVLKGWDEDSTGMAMFAAEQVSPAETIRLAQRALAAHPDDVQMHRRYQAVLDEAGQEQRLLQEYGEKARSEPDSAAAQYLYANLLRGRAGIAALDKLAASHGNDPDIVRSLTWRRMTQGDYDGTLKGWKHLQTISAAEAARIADAEVRALVASNRAPEAAALLAKLLGDPQDSSRIEHMAEYLMVVKLTGGDPRQQLERFGKNAKDDADIDPVRVRAGMEPVAGEAQQRMLVRLMLALRSDPAAAVRLAEAMPQLELAQLGPEQWGLLFGEAVRSNHAAVVAKLGRVANLGMSRADRVTLERFVKGEAVTLDELTIEPGLRAAAMLVRSRNGSLPAGERAQLRAAATRADLLHSVVSSALVKWPA